MNARTRRARAAVRRRGRITRGMARRRREFPDVSSWVFIEPPFSLQWGAWWDGNRWQRIDWGGMPR